MSNNFEIKVSGKRGAGKAKLISHIMSSITNPSHIFAIGEHYSDTKAYTSDALLRNHFIEFDYKPDWVFRTARLIIDMVGNNNEQNVFNAENSYYLIIEMYEPSWQRELITHLLEEINKPNIIPVFISIMQDCTN